MCLNGKGGIYVRTYCIKIERENYRQFSKQRFVDSSGAWIPQGDHPGGLQVRPRSPQRIQTPKSKIQTQNPEPNTQNLGSPPVKPKIPTQNPKYQIQNPNPQSRTQHLKSRIPPSNPKSRRKSKIPNPKSNPKIQNPTSKISDRPVKPKIPKKTTTLRLHMCRFSARCEPALLQPRNLQKRFLNLSERLNWFVTYRTWCVSTCWWKRDVPRVKWLLLFVVDVVLLL